MIAEANAAALAVAIEALLLDPMKIKALGDAGRQAITERFTLDRMASEVAQLCAALRKTQP